MDSGVSSRERRQLHVLCTLGSWEIVCGYTADAAECCLLRVESETVESGTADADAPGQRHHRILHVFTTCNQCFKAPCS